MKRFSLVLFVLLAVGGQSRADLLVNTVSDLVSAVNNTATGGDTTILVADGIYNLNGSSLRIVTQGVTVRSYSGNRSGVILNGNQQTTEIFQILASQVTVSDMTLQQAQDHPVHVMGGENRDISDILLHNLHIIDPGQQAIKINLNGDYTTERGTVSDCLIELTEAGRAYVVAHNGSCYTGGIDAHGAMDWIIRDNKIQGFWCAESLSEHGIHLWSGSTNTLVERNLIFDCDRGIGFGLGSSGHYGGIIRNNMICQIEDHGYSDVGIGLETTTNAEVYNNTIYIGHDYTNAIEYRFSDSSGNTIMNNLTNKSIASRDSGQAEVTNNVTAASSAWFVDSITGDLHLQSSIAEVVNQGVGISGLDDDFDKGSRPYNGGIDVGADEYGSSSVSEEPPGPGVSVKAMPQLLLLLQGN